MASAQWATGLPPIVLGVRIMRVCAVRSEPLDDAASHLAELAEEVVKNRGHLRLTRSGRANLVLLTEDEFASMQETIALAGDPVARRESPRPMRRTPRVTS